MDKELAQALQAIRDDIADVKNDVSGIKLKLENEIEPNIRTLAENQVSMMNDLREVKQKQEEMADDIKEHGQIQALMAHQLQQGGFIHLYDDPMEP